DHRPRPRPTAPRRPRRGVPQGRREGDLRPRPRLAPGAGPARRRAPPRRLGGRPGRAGLSAGADREWRRRAGPGASSSRWARRRPAQIATIAVDDTRAALTGGVTMATKKQEKAKRVRKTLAHRGATLPHGAGGPDSGHSGHKGHSRPPSGSTKRTGG